MFSIAGSPPRVADNVPARTGFGIALCALVLMVGGCASSGPGPIQNGSGAVSGTDEPTKAPASVASVPASAVATPSASAAATASPTAEGSATPFALTSAAIHEGGEIPSTYTCDGADVSPPLDWVGAPGGTRSLALIVTDPDANDFVHWIVFDASGSPGGGLPEGVAASSPDQGRNDFGKRGYGGPCPPSGTHHYRFTLYALDRTLALTGTPTRDDLAAAMRGHILGQVTLSATYRRH